MLVLSNLWQILICRIWKQDAWWNSGITENSWNYLYMYMHIIWYLNIVNNLHIVSNTKQSNTEKAREN